MNCLHPFCHREAVWVPVIAVPTLRYSSTKDEFIKTDKPTLLVGKEICQFHKDNYNFEYWMDERDWAKMQDVAKSQGLKIEDRPLVNVQFRPVGWRPNNFWMELERGNPEWTIPGDDEV